MVGIDQISQQRPAISNQSYMQQNETVLTNSLYLKEKKEMSDSSFYDSCVLEIALCFVDHFIYSSMLLLIYMYTHACESNDCVCVTLQFS